MIYLYGHKVHIKNRILHRHFPSPLNLNSSYLHMRGLRGDASYFDLSVWSTAVGRTNLSEKYLNSR